MVGMKPIVATALGWVALAGLVAAFWIIVGPRISIAPWMIAAVPGALVGILLAKIPTRKPVRFLLLLALAFLSATFGVWMTTHGQLLRAADRPMPKDQELKELIARAEAELPKEPSKDPLAESPKESAPAKTLKEEIHPKVRWGQSWSVASDRIARDPASWLASAGVTLIVGWMGLRVASRGAERSP